MRQLKLTDGLLSDVTLRLTCPFNPSEGFPSASYDSSEVLTPFSGGMTVIGYPQQIMILKSGINSYSGGNGRQRVSSANYDSEVLTSFQGGEGGE